MQIMDSTACRAFLLGGSKTGKVAMVRTDGRPHVAPIWFTLDGDDIVFMTMSTSLKAKVIAREPRVSMAVDEEVFPYAFALVEGTASIETPSPDALLDYSRKIAERYVPTDRVEEFARRNAVDGEVLVRIRPTKIIAKKGIAD